MASNHKYAGLPDLDFAPDIYETPELTDDTSTRPASRAPRSESSASSYKDLDDTTPAGIEIDRHRLNPNEARLHFVPARVDARDVDFSDRIDGRRRSYWTSSRKRRQKAKEGEIQSESSDEDEATVSTLQRRIARLHKEAEELKAEVQRQKEGNISDVNNVEQVLVPDTLNQLGDALKVIETIDTETSANAQLRLAQKLQATSMVPPPLTNGTAPPISNTNGTSYVVTYAPSYTNGHTLAKVVEFDARLTVLETAVGINSLPLHPQQPSSTKPILPTLDILDRQVSFLSSTTPISLESMSKKIRQLTVETERLNEARQSAKTSVEELKVDKRRSLSPVTDGETGDPVHDPEQASKINALYGAIPTIENMAPVLPSVLDRLRSLRLIHADAASASQSLAALEKRQAEITKEIRSWREGLEKVEGVLNEGEERMKENVAVVEGWVREVEGRMRKLGV